MIGTFFSFSGRIGRLQYFGSAIVLGVGMGILAMFSFASALGHSAGKGASLSGVAASFLPLLIAAPLMLWASLALQTKRIRDIGWNPGVVIPLWMIVSTAAGLTGVLAGKGSALGAVGGLLNLAMSCVLLFWPGNGLRDDDGGKYHLDLPQVYHEPPPRPREAARLPGDPPLRRAEPIVPVRPATRRPPPPPQGPRGFGRRVT